MQLFEEAGRLVERIYDVCVRGRALRYSTLQNSRPPRDRSTISHRAHSHGAEGSTSYSSVHVNEPCAQEVYLRPATECGSRTLNTGTWSVPLATLCRDTMKRRTARKPLVLWRSLGENGSDPCAVGRRAAFTACGFTTGEREREGGTNFCATDI